ncbi:MAG: helix-turn-helix domain-containing protein, partial [Deltaproteobacteria bacterium]
MKGSARVGPGFFPPELVVQIKALACELPSAYQQPLSRWSVSDLSRYAQRCGLVATISQSTIWRWLNQDAIRPWRYRCWIFPRDPLFAPKAGRVLDLYHRIWDGQPLGEQE